MSYVLKAATTANTYGVGLAVEPNEAAETDLGGIYLIEIELRNWKLLSVNETTQHGMLQIYNGLTPTIVATDANGIDWEAK